MTQQQLSESSGVPQATISMIESGERKNPGIMTMWMLATALQCKVDDIIGGDEE